MPDRGTQDRTPDRRAQDRRDTQDRRTQVLQLLRRAPAPLTIAAVADALGVHPNTARAHLESLVADGSAERAATRPDGPGRPPVAFRARPGMDRHAPRNYELLAGVLVRHLASRPHAASSAIAAGHAWGRDRAAATRASARDPLPDLVDLLDGLGFAPEPPRPDARDDDRYDLGLRSCPFLELADDYREVVCGVHLGFMRGALDAWGSDVVVGRLDPFVEPDRCVARLTRTPSARPHVRPAG